MINRFEISRKAKELGLQSSTIEKDYVLGWILIGIQHHLKIKDSWVFKGGTCLKKCFFNRYRFSEDLDFTLMDPQHVNEETLRSILKEIAQWIYEQSGIEIPENLILLEPHRSLSVQCKLSYQGPLKQRAPYPTIKLDLTADEQIVLNPERRIVFHEYSDGPDETPQILSYSYEEIFAEKLRALAERARPRDLYDVVHLYQERYRLTNIEKLLESLKGKCAFKNMPLPNIATIERHPKKLELSSEWKNMLHHQVKELLPFDYFWGCLPDVFAWIYGKEGISQGENISLGSIVADNKGEQLIEKVKKALAAGADVNDDSRNGHRPLQIALADGHTEIARLLIEHGADLYFRDRSGKTPLQVAINHGQFQIADLLIKKGVPFNRNNLNLEFDYVQHYRYTLGP